MSGACLRLRLCAEELVRCEACAKTWADLPSGSLRPAEEEPL